MDTIKNEITSSHLTDYVNDFVENNLEPFEYAACLEFFDQNPVFLQFVNKAMEGKQRLKNAYTVRAADDFEEKLAKRIAALEGW